MNIVIDTNAVISGTFFGGHPRKVLEAIVDKTLTAFATAEIVEEYRDIVEEMIRRKQGHLSPAVLTSLIKSLRLIEPLSDFHASRDPDDDKSSTARWIPIPFISSAGIKTCWSWSASGTWRSSPPQSFVSVTWIILIFR